MTSADYDRGLEDGAALAHRDAFVLVRELRAENERLRAVEAAALVLRARVWDWGVVPFRGPGHEEEYDFANNAAEDRILEAADAFDAAASACDKGT